MIDLVECSSPFRIEGQRDHRAVGIGPLSAFRWQQGDVHMRLDRGLGNIVVSGKGQR